MKVLDCMILFLDFFDKIVFKLIKISSRRYKNAPCISREVPKCLRTWPYLFYLAQNSTDFPESFFSRDVFLEIIDHPISAIDSKKSKSLVRWKESDCAMKKSKIKGKSVFHKVIPFCNEDFVQNTIQGRGLRYFQT